MYALTGSYYSRFELVGIFASATPHSVSDASTYFGATSGLQDKYALVGGYWHASGLVGALFVNLPDPVSSAGTSYDTKAITISVGKVV